MNDKDTEEIINDDKPLIKTNMDNTDKNTQPLNKKFKETNKTKKLELTQGEMQEIKELLKKFAEALSQKLEDSNKKIQLWSEEIKNEGKPAIEEVPNNETMELSLIHI